MTADKQAYSGHSESENRVLGIIAIGFALVFGAVAMMIFFSWLPTDGTTLGVDVLVEAFEGGTIHYAERFGLLNPPWSVLPLIPLGFFPKNAAWGLQVYALLVILVISIPKTEKRWQFFLHALIVVTAFPTLRTIADGQLELLVIGGLLLVHQGYKRQSHLLLALGILLATSKPQAVFIVMLVLGVFMLTTWRITEWLKTGLLVLAVVGATLLWKGQAWWIAINNFAFNDTLIDASLSGAFERLNAPTYLFAITWLLLAIGTAVLVFRGNRALSREKIAFLVTSSMLLAPYTGANGLIVILTIGILPLSTRKWSPALVALVLINLGYYFNQGQFIFIFSYYITITLLIIWGIFAWDIFQEEIANKENIQHDAALR